MRRNSLLIKSELERKYFQFHSSCMLFFISLQYCCFRSSEFNNTFLYQIKGGVKQSQEHQHPCHILLEFCHSSPPFCKNHKKIGRACKIFTLSKGFAFSSYRCSKQSVSRVLSVNWSEHFIRWGCFQICSGNNKSLLLYACEVIHLINKSVISPYVQKQGRILRKFNVLRLHYVTHYCA